MGRHSVPTVERTPIDRQEEPLPPPARHRSRNGARRRGIAGWPLAVVGLLVLSVLGWLGWSWANSEVDSRATAQAASCTDGNETLRVAAAPGSEGAARTAADRWNQKRTVVHAYCVRVKVVSADPQTVFTGLTGGWNGAKLGPRPQAWIAQPARTDQLATKFPDLVSAQPEPVRSGSFVALNGDDINDIQLRAAQQFRAFMQQKTTSK
ncbi:MAG: hypothetical protein GEU98_09330 [Pseudonocardiaceae bacterium]|nr:hypothetical protein [Pseudonocardiaceae bacterium]